MLNSSSGEAMHGVGVSQLLLLTAVVGLVLAMLQGLTHVPSGYGIEDFLGWIHPDAVLRVTALWDDTFQHIGLEGVPNFV